MGFLIRRRGHSIWSTRAEGWILFQIAVARVVGAHEYAEYYTALNKFIMPKVTKEAKDASVVRLNSRGGSALLAPKYKDDSFKWTWSVCGRIAELLAEVRELLLEEPGVEEESLDKLIAGLQLAHTERKNLIGG